MCKKDEFHLLILRKSPTGLCLWIMPCCCLFKCIIFSSGFCPCRAFGKWSMQEYLWYLFVAGVTAGCSFRWKAGPLSPTASPRALSEWVAKLLWLPEYFTVVLQVLCKDLFFSKTQLRSVEFWVFLTYCQYFRPVIVLSLSGAKKPASFNLWFPRSFDLIQAVWIS